MTSQNQSADQLTTQTVQALSGSPSDVSLTDGASLIDSWISSLGAESPIGSSLSALKTSLQSGSADSSEISSMLTDLADQTQDAASSADSDTQASLQQLAASLKSFGQQL